MAKTTLQKNRRKVVDSLFSLGYLKKITLSDPIVIDEENVVAGKLKKVTLINFPLSDQCECNVYEIFLEKKGVLHSMPEGLKRAERAILVVTCCSIYVLLVEMKNSLKPYAANKDGHIESIREKFQDSIGKVKVLLSHFLIDEKELDIYFKCFIVYNNDSLTGQAVDDPRLKADDLFKIFSNVNKTRIMLVKDSIGDMSYIEVLFKRNDSGNVEEYEIDILNDVFVDDDKMQNAIYADCCLHFSC